MGAEETKAEIRDFKQATVASSNAMRGRFDAAAAGQRQIVELIQTVIDDRRHG